MNPGSIMPGSLKGKLLWGVFLYMILLVIAGGIGIYFYFRGYLFRELDHALLDKLRYIRASCVQDGNELKFELPQLVWRRVQDDYDPEFFQLWRAGTGESLHKSWDEYPGELPDLGAGSRGPVFADLILPSGEKGRVAGQAFVPEIIGESGAPIEIHVAVAHDNNRIRAALAEFRELVVIGGLVSSGILLAGTFLIVDRNLRPLSELSRQIDEVPVGAGKVRFALKAAPEELNPVVERLNALMDRVDAALENERQFTSNAAHELRNPLAGMRSQLELALNKGRGEDEYRGALSEVLRIENRLEAMVGNLLLLTRLQAGQDEVKMSEVSIPELLRRKWKPFYDEAERKSLKVSLDCSKDVSVIRSSINFLEIVLRNLFDNAVSYTEQGGRISIRASRNGSGIEISVANTNPDLSEKEVEKMFERFWRASAAREGDHQHVGIGLPLTQRVVAALGGKIKARLDGNGLLEISVTLPDSAA